jgi:catechol-2,3-dioxygenase
MAYVEQGAVAIHERGGPGTHIAFRVSKDERAALKHALDEAEIENHERDHEVAVGLFFDDPDGHTLEAITYGGASDPPPA